MPNLSCKVKECIHNAAYECTAGAIQINGSAARSSENTFCATFTDNPGTYIMSTMEHKLNRNGAIYPSNPDVEFADEIAPENLVSCTARKCVHNNSYRCHAGHIMVERGARGQSSQCRTFKSR